MSLVAGRPDGKLCLTVYLPVASSISERLMRVVVQGVHAFQPESAAGASWRLNRNVPDDELQDLSHQ